MAEFYIQQCGGLLTVVASSNPTPTSRIGEFTLSTEVV